MIPDYTKLINARYELEMYLKSISKYHITRSFIEESIYNIDKVMKANPTTQACTSKLGYVDQKLKETGRY